MTVDGIDDVVLQCAGGPRHGQHVHGVVVHGDHRGTEIGFPTANVAVPGDTDLPADGVYAGWYERPDGSVHRAAVSIGRRPTFYADHGLLLVEAHLLDFEGNLYGEGACVRLERRLRAQVRFASVADLVTQLRRDVADARRFDGYAADPHPTSADPRRH